MNRIRKRLQIGFHPIVNCCPPPHLYGKIRLKVNSAVYLPITTIPITISVTHVFFFFVLRFYPYIGCKKTVPDKIFLMSDDVLICMHHFFFAPKNSLGGRKQEMSPQKSRENATAHSSGVCHALSVSGIQSSLGAVVNIIPGYNVMHRTLWLKVLLICKI